jgi:hypothetical protein
MIGIALIALLLIAAASYSVVRFKRCPANKLTAIEQYRRNRPILPDKFIINGNQKAIATALVPLWLVGFTSHQADALLKLEDFEVDGVDVGQWKDDKFLASAIVSVKPMKCSYEQWLSGTGEESEGWVRNKSLSLTIMKDGDHYIVDRVDSSP